MSDRGRFLAVTLLAAIGIAACVPTPAGRTDTASAPAGTSTAGSPATGSPSPSADPAATPSFVRPTPNPSPTFLVHVVEAGDSLTSVARRYGTTARSIAYWNREQYPSLDPDSETYEPDQIKVGWTLLLIPTATVDEEELPEPTPTAPAPATASPSPS
jgi:hypothetical protein